MNQKKEDSRHPRGGGLLGAVIVVLVLWIGWLEPWWAANRGGTPLSWSRVI